MGILHSAPSRCDGRRRRSAPTDSKAADSKAADKDAKPPEPPVAKPAVTHHKITLGGKAIAYTATASTLELKNDTSEITGRMFSVAYTAEGVTDVTARPVTFVFNGGPGSASLWLHMASFGPMRVDVTDAAPTPPPPYAVRENPDSLLDKTDLVFIDAMGTGYSRIATKGEAKGFYGTDADIAAFAQFIERWVGTNGRWNSPKFLLGESYGTTRAAGLLNALQGKGMAFNGTIMVSSYLNAYDDLNAPPFGSDLPYVLYLPTMAATAWYHDRLDPKPADLAAYLQEVRTFALGEYMHALAQGSHLGDAERSAISAKLHRYTAMSEAAIRNGNLRIDPSRFQKELLRDQRRTVGRLDARFQGIDHDAAGEAPESDAASDAFSAAVTAAFNAYVHGDLQYSTEELYKPTNYGEVGHDWDDRHEVGGRHYDMPDVAEDLRIAMSANPHLGVLGQQLRDFATPFFETRYTVSRVGIEPAPRENIAWGYYPAGHMIYVNPTARTQMKADLAKFYDRATAR